MKRERGRAGIVCKLVRLSASGDNYYVRYYSRLLSEVEGEKCTCNQEKRRSGLYSRQSWLCERCRRKAVYRLRLNEAHVNLVDRFLVRAVHRKSGVSVDSDSFRGDAPVRERRYALKMARDWVHSELRYRRESRRSADRRETMQFGCVRLGRNGERVTVASLLQSKDWKVRMARYDLGPIGPEPHVGVEIECAVNVDSTELAHSVAKAGLASKVTIVHDGSLSFTQDVYPIEVRVCDAQSRILETLRRTCELLAHHKAIVNKTCGLHVHLDMRRRDMKQSFTKLYRALPWLYSLVSDSRRERNQYAKRNRSPQPNRGERYFALNAVAYRTHKTVEVRLHQGTVELEKMARWIELLIRIVDGPELRSCPRNLWDLAAKLNLSSELVGYIARRAVHAAAERLVIPPTREVL